MLGPVDHDRGEAIADALDDLVKAGAVVKMQRHRNSRGFCSGFNERHDVVKAGIFDGPLAGLDDNWGLFSFGSHHNGLDDFHVVAVKGTDCIAAFFSGGQEGVNVYEWHDKIPP